MMKPGSGQLRLSAV